MADAEREGAVQLAAIDKDKFGGESRGFGLVEGRPLTVNETWPRTDRPRPGGGGGVRGGFGGGRSRY